MMHEGTESPKPVETAHAVLAGTQEPLAVLRIREFADDVEAHDEELQNRLSGEFEAAFSEAARSLESVFGPFEDLIENDSAEGLPVGGVFLALAWQVGDRRLYLAAAHEDRETPFLLVLGVVE